MQPGSTLFFKYELVVAAIALLGGIVQWFKAGWLSAAFIFVWIFVLLNLPVLWYAGRTKVLELWRSRK
jgi:hypothetical protein